jgi:hypothetical protein
MRFPRLPPCPLWLLAPLLLISATLSHAAPREVRVGAFVNSVSAIDPAEGTYGISLYLWFLDPAGTFDPVNDLYVLARSSTFSEVYDERVPNGGGYVSIRLDAVVDQEFDLTDFPFDEQRLLLRLEAAETVDTLRLVPDAEAPQIADYVELVDWTLSGVALAPSEHRYTVRYGLSGSEPQVFSQIELTIDAARVQTSVVIDDFLGFIFSFIISALIYLVPCNELATRAAMTTGSLFAALLNLNRLLQAAGFKSEFGLVEKLGFLIFGAILCSLTVSIVMKRVAERWGLERANRIDAIIGMVVMPAFLIAILWVLRAGMR